MSDTIFKQGIVKARKNHHSDGCLFFDWMMKLEGKRNVVDPKEYESMEMTTAEVALIQKAYDNNWQIQKGEECFVQSGIYDGDFYNAYLPLGIQEILVKYDLFTDD